MKSINYFLLAFLLCVLSPKLFADEMVVIINMKNPVTSLTEKETREYFLQNVDRWKFGKKIRLSDNQNSDKMRESFLQQILRMTPIEIERYWLEQQYSRAKRPPTVLSSNQEVLRFVRKFKGAIGVVDRSAVNDEVKVVLNLTY